MGSIKCGVLGLYAESVPTSASSTGEQAATDFAIVGEMPQTVFSAAASSSAGGSTTTGELTSNENCRWCDCEDRSRELTTNPECPGEMLFL